MAIIVKGMSVRKGLEADLKDGVLQEAELGFATDTNKLFVGYKKEDGTLSFKDAVELEDLRKELAFEKEMREKSVQISITEPKSAPIGGLWAVQE